MLKPILNKIKAPVFPIFAITFPVLLPIVFAPEAFNHETFLVNLAWGLLISNLYLLFGNASLLLGGLLFIPIGLMEICHFTVFKSPISQASIFVLLETNMNEASEFVSDNFLWEALLGCILYIGVAIYLFGNDIRRFSSSFGEFKYKKGSIFLVVFILLGVFDRVFDKKYSIAFPTAISSVIEYSRDIQEYRDILNNSSKLANKKVDASIKTPLKQELHVVVIGESTNRNHMSIYGYYRKTTPLLQALKDNEEIVVFNDVISPFTHTQPALKSALTTLDHQSEKKFYEAESIIDISKSAGYQVSWLSNQSQFGLWDNFLNIFAKSAHKTHFVNLGACCNTVSFDDKLIEPFEMTLASNGKKSQVILIHLMGTHGSYVKRYPFEFEVFKEWDNTKERTINQYDNAVLYNDFIVKKLIDILKKHSTQNPKKLITMLYFSDHGEEVYDSIDFSGHDMYRLTRHQVEIPFMVWLSESFKKEYPNKYRTIKSNVNTPFMTDDLIHSFIDLTRIETPLLKNERSLFSENYQPRKRMVYKKDYDTELK